MVRGRISLSRAVRSTSGDRWATRALPHLPILRHLHGRCSGTFDLFCVSPFGDATSVPRAAAAVNSSSAKARLKASGYAAAAVVTKGP